MKLLLILPLILISCQFGQKEKEPTIYHIPSDFRGEVLIVYGIKNGEPPRTKRNKRFFEISQDGRLRTQTTISYGLSNDDFFLISSNGSGQKIDFEVNTQNDTSVCIYNMTTGTLEIKGSQYEYEAFMVCRKDSVNYYTNFELNP